MKRPWKPWEVIQELKNRIILVEERKTRRYRIEEKIISEVFKLKQGRR